jgi:hypothetical protein
MGVADIRTAIDIPQYGPPTGCSGGGQGASGCGCGNCSGGCGCGGSGAGLAPVPVPVADCADSAWSPCTSGQTSYAGLAVGDALDALAALARGVEGQVQQPLALAERCEAAGACCRVELSAGSPILTLQLQPPAAGPSDPRPLLTYVASGASSGSTYGAGWDDAYHRRIQSVSGTAVNVITGRGPTYSYTNLSGGYYTPPGEARNSLRQLSGGGWLERCPPSRNSCHFSRLIV